MNYFKLKDMMEYYQINIYFTTIVIAVLTAFFIPNSASLEVIITPALAFMLFVTFLQLPILELKFAFKKINFILALLFSNFIIIPIIVFGLIQFLPDNPLLKLGVLIVLLSPCVDYVVTFSHLGKANAKLLLASTPILLIVQMLLLPIYLNIFLGENSSKLIEFSPFIEALVYLILIPLFLALILQIYSKKSTLVLNFTNLLNLFPVPSTAFILFVIILFISPKLSSSINDILLIIPIYIAFSLIAPIVGFNLGKLFKLNIEEKRSIAFSSATRNSLVILPLALAIPNALPLVPAVIVTQTFIELISEIVYIKFFSRESKVIQ